MTDLAFGLQQAIYDALIAAGVPVYEEAAEDTPTPYVIYGEDVIQNIGDKCGGQLEIHTVTIVTFTDMQGKKAMRTIQETNRRVLHQQPISAPGCLFGNLEHQEGEDARLDDGVTYVGTQKFQTIAQPAV